MTGLYYFVAALLVALDQITKYLARTLLMGQGTIVLIPGFLGLEYVENTGMAFSALTGFTPLLTVVSLVLSLLLAGAIWKKWMLTLVLAGAVGNLIDRALFGYVTDMIKTLFMTFPVFNVADCCVVVGAFALAGFILFFWKEERQEEVRS